MSDDNLALERLEKLLKPIDIKCNEIIKASDRINIFTETWFGGTLSDRRRAEQEVDSLVLNVNRIIRDTQQELVDVKAQLTTSVDSTMGQFERNMFNARIRRFGGDAIAGYQEALHLFAVTRDKTLRRQAKLVDPTLSDIDIDALLGSRRIGVTISEGLRKEFKILCAEFERVEALKKSVMEIEELFNSLALLSFQNQVILDKIEDAIKQSNEKAQTGKKAIDESEQYVYKERKTKVKTAITAFLGLFGLGLGGSFGLVTIKT